jgi:hypothetical protein
LYTLSEIYSENNLPEVLEIVLKSSKDTNLTVMVRSSQACSFLAQKTTDARLVSLILYYCNLGKENTTANGIRALGQLNIQVDKKIESILVQGLNNKSAKVTWNACVAVGKFIQRRDEHADSNLLESTKTTKILFKILSTHQNLKSRIQAA